MTAAEIAALLRHPGAGDRGEVRAARQARRRRRRARQRPLGQGGRTPARRDRLRSEGDRRRHVLRLDVARPRRLAGGAAHRATASAPRTPSRSSTTTSRMARRSRCGSRATCCARSRSSRTSSSSPRAASPTSSTTRTRSRASCSTSETALWPGSSSPTASRTRCSGSHAITNGAYSLQVKVAGGGSVDPDGYRFLDVQDPAEMKGGLDQESLPNFVAAARGAAERSGLTLADLDFVCPLHTKRSMFEALLVRARNDRGAGRLPRRHRPHERRRPSARPRPRRPRRAASATGTRCCSSPPAPATRGQRASCAGEPGMSSWAG